MPARLFETERHKRRAPTCTDLIYVPRERCFNCRGLMDIVRVGQPSLFRGWGYGAIKRTTMDVCRDCNATWVRDVTEVKPYGG